MATTEVRPSKASDRKKAPMSIPNAKTLAAMAETDEIIRAHRIRFGVDRKRNGVDKNIEK